MLKLLMLEVASKAGAAKTAFELRGVRLRRPLARKNVEGWARAAMRSIEVDDIRRDWWWRGVVVDFRRALEKFEVMIRFSNRPGDSPLSRF